ncbi:MAG: photosystem II complex extrinsic protein PsbU [Prochloraceae cyanobacterium]|nr:photosystem II complex extrinsic protein PsbU [Prochloraceae cyanobacterium]
MNNWLEQLSPYWLILLVGIFISGWGILGSARPIIASPLSLQSPQILIVEDSRKDLSLCEIDEEKIDLNNANLIAFADCPGFYPILAKLIVTHSPYQKVEEVLEIAELSEVQKERLLANLDNFIVGEPIVPLERRMPPRPAMRK